MPNYTKFLGLILPHKSENYTVDVANTNNNLIDEELEKKLDKIPGKSLSANDFTNEYKNKLDSLKNYDDSSLEKRISNLETDNRNSKKSISNIEEEQKTQNSNIEDLKEKSKMLEEENKRLREELNNSTITASNTGEDITITDSAEARFKKLVVSGNSVQDGEPSPENPIEIKNCGSNINLFDGELELGSLGNNTGQPSAYTTIVRSKNFQLVKPNTTYTLSNNMNYANYIYEYDENQNFIKLTAIKATNTIVTNDNTKYIKFRSTTTDTVYENDLNVKYKLEEGSIATPYSPHNCGNVNVKITNDADKEQIINFPLKEGQVLHKGDFLAEDGIHQARNTYIFDGTENFSTHNTMNNIVGWRFKPVPSSINMEDLICTYFKGVVWDIYNTPETRGYGMVSTLRKGLTDTHSDAIYITQPNAEIDTANKLKAFFLEQYQNGTPVKIEYPLAEEEIEPYTPEQQEAWEQIKNAKTYKGTTRIYSEDEISPIFEEEHLVDLEAYINNKIGVQTTQQEMPNQEQPSIEEAQVEETKIIGGEE